MATGGWEINSGPDEFQRPGARDELARVYGVARSDDERGTVVFAMTRTAAGIVVSPDTPIEVEDAFRTKGEQIVREALEREPRPRTIVMDSKGQLTYTPG